MSWASWYWDLCDMTEHEARAHVASTDDDTVLAFWEWSDSEARMAIAAARDGTGDYSLAALADSLRDSLVGDVVAEIRHRRAVTDAGA